MGQNASKNIGVGVQMEGSKMGLIPVHTDLEIHMV